MYSGTESEALGSFCFKIKHHMIMSISLSNMILITELYARSLMHYAGVRGTAPQNSCWVSHDRLKHKFIFTLKLDLTPMILTCRPSGSMYASPEKNQ